MSNDVAILVLWGTIFLGLFVVCVIEAVCTPSRWSRVLSLSVSTVPLSMVLVATYGLYWQLFVQVS